MATDFTNLDSQSHPQAPVFYKNATTSGPQVILETPYSRAGLYTDSAPPSLSGWQEVDYALADSYHNVTPLRQDSVKML